MHPVGPVKEQPGIGRHRRVLAEHVLQRGRACSRRVRDIARLGELLRVAHQDERPRCVRDGEHVGQRQLAGLVGEQHVDAAGELLTCPQPGGARHQVKGAVPECYRVSESVTLIERLAEAWESGASPLTAARMAAAA